MKKRTAIRAMTYLFAAAVCLGACAMTEKQAADAADRELRYLGEQAFAELCDAVGNMDSALKKARFSITPAMTAALCAEVYSRAQSASDALSALPFPMQQMERTASFLSRTGDYAAFLIRRSGAGEDVGDTERETIRSLSESASLLADNLRQLRTDLADGAAAPEALSAAEAGLPAMSDSFLHMEQEFPELPALVYDGPFSDDMLHRTPRMTAGASDISESAALLVAAGFLGIRSNTASPEGPAEGKIPSWRITAGDRTVYVSRQGGYVVEAVSARLPVRTVLTVEDALASAEKFLAARGMGSLRESYHMVKDNILTATWCAAEGETICYPDMVKTDVAMDDGEILGFDARAYLTAHTSRTLPEPVLTEEEAAAKVPEGLSLEGQRLALIPARGTEEVFCRELVCRTEEGEHYLLYFNAVTGAQEKILILLEDETGTLAL